MVYRFARVALVTVFVACSSALGAEKSLGSTAEVEAALKDAKPGDVLVLNDGEWNDAVIRIEAKGTKDQPITLRAKTPGRVKLLGKSRVVLAGDHCVVSGLLFGESTATESAIAFTGNDNRVTESAVVAQDRGGKWVHFQKGQRNRLDRCYFEGHKPQDVTLQVEIEENQPNEARVDHNHFGPRPPLGKNGGETIRVGYSGQQTRVSKTLVEHNLFDRCDGEVEIISSKCTDSTYRHNTFRDCEGTITLRHGGRCTVDGNFFFGRPDGKSGGIRVIGAGHTIVNNYLENVGPSAGGVIALTTGMREPKPTDYQHVNGATITFNTIVNSGLPYLRLDAFYRPDREQDVLPKDVVVANNVFVAGGEGSPEGEAKTFVAGQEGAGYTWVGNIAHGAQPGDAGSASKGIRLIDPQLTRGEDKLFRPANDSPVRGAAEGDFAKIDHDVDLQPRGAKRDAGADQVSDEKGKSKPLTAADVGPSWMKDRGVAAPSAATK